MTESTVYIYTVRHQQLTVIVTTKKKSTEKHI